MADTDIPMIPATTPVTVPPVKTPPVYDRWWLYYQFTDGADTSNVKVGVILRRMRLNDDGEVQWMSDAEAEQTGVAHSVSYTIDQVLQRAKGAIIGDPDDPMNSAQAQGILAQIASGVLQATTALGNIRGVL